MKYVVAVIAAILIALSGTSSATPAQKDAPPVSGSTAPTVQTTTVPSTTTGDHSLENTVAYLRTYGTLPDYYLTKKEAGKLGWVPSRGNLNKVAPGMLIGGDIFTNAQHLLPTAKGRVWHEADFDYTHGSRNAKRILFSNDGLIFITTDHYKTVTQL